MCVCCYQISRPKAAKRDKSLDHAWRTHYKRHKEGFGWFRWGDVDLIPWPPPGANSEKYNFFVSWIYYLFANLTFNQLDHYYHFTNINLWEEE